MTAHWVKSWITDSFRKRSGAGVVMTDRRLRAGRVARRDTPGVETLENRVVLSGAGGGSLLGSLSYVGVVTSPIVVPAQPVNPIGPWASARQNSQGAQLNSDVQTLRTELQTLAAKSGVTVADLESLTTDSQSIAQSKFHFNAQTLNPVISELATAVAGGTSKAQAETDFTNLFSGSSVSTTVINTTFSDLVKAIGDSAVTTTDLSTVASDEAAIKTDLSNLPWRFQPFDDGFLTFGTGPTISLSLSSTAINLPNIVVGPTPIPISVAGGSSLLESLTDAGVVTSPVVTSQTPSAEGTSGSSFTQLQTDVQKLQGELQTLGTKSGVNIADLENLTTDGQSIAQAGFHFNSQTLNPVISELATAVASGASKTNAQQDFTSLFSGSSVSTTVISTTFNDLVRAISDSKVMPADLTTVAADKTAIQVDLQNLHKSTGSMPVGHHYSPPVSPPPIVHSHKHSPLKLVSRHKRH